MDYKKLIPNQKLRLKILKLTDFLPDALMIKFQYRIKTGRKLNLKNPQRYSEKLQWYKLYYRTPLLAQIASYSDPLSSVNYEEFYREEVGHKGGYVSRLSSLFKQESFSGLRRRLRPSYFRALVSEFQNYVRETRHRRLVFKRMDRNKREKL